MTADEITQLELELTRGYGSDDAGNELAEQNKGSTSPHQLIAIPRALLRSEKWKALPATSKNLYWYLLTFSNTRTFKDSYPGTDRIEEDLRLTQKRRIAHEKKLVRARILKVHPPGRTVKLENGKYFTYKSKSYEFTLIEYINADFLEYNRAKGQTIYKPVQNLSALETQVKRIERKSGRKLMSVLGTKQGKILIYNMFSKRLKLNGADDLGRVHVALHSTLFHPSLVEDQLQKNVIIKQEKKNSDLVIDPKMTWKKFLELIDKEAAYAKHRSEMSKLIGFVDAIETAKTN